MKLQRMNQQKHNNEKNSVLAYNLKTFLIIQKFQRNKLTNIMTNLLQINQHIYIDQSKLLGKGSTGNVYLGGSYRDHGLKFAVKAIDLSEVNNQVTQYLLSCEIVALSQLAKLNIDHVVKLHEIAFQEGYCYLIMELLEGGSLAEYIRENPNGLSEKEVQQLFRQLFEGYRAIRNLGIVHRDIKPDNIIFRHKPTSTSQKKLCFIDFGYCTKQSVPNRPQVYYNVGSPKYMSPQAYKKNTYSQKSDMWALGVILYEMLHGRTIDKDMDMEEYMRFMEHSDIPFSRNVNVFLKNLVCGLLAFDVNKRISCEVIDQMLNGSPLHINQNRKQINNHQINNQQFPAFVPQLQIPTQNINKRNSPFYRSQIVTHRSDPSQTVTNFHSHHHPNNQQFDPRRQQRNFSQENELREFGHSPKKILHLEHNVHKVSGVVSNVPFEGDKRQFVEKFRQFEQRNYSKQFFNGQTGPVRRQLQKIQQEHDNQGSRHNLMRINSTAHNFRIQPDMKRSFLKAMDQGQFQPKFDHQQSPQIINNPNVRFLNNANIPPNSSNPSRQSQLYRSQIFHLNNDKRFNSGNNFFSSQINQNPQGNIKVITSDKTINNRSFEQNEGEVFCRNLNKSYSTNNVAQKVQIRLEGQPSLVQSRFVPVAFKSSNGPQPLETFPPQNIRPIDLLMQNKQIANNRAFLRNTMPNVYRSSIDPAQFAINQQPMNPHNQPQNLQNSKDLRQRETTIVEQINHSNFKKHGSYFDSNFMTPQKQSNLQNNLNSVEFRPTHPFTAIQNRNQKSHSFKVIQNEAPHSMQRDRTMINLLNQSPSPMSHQQLQFNQPMMEVNHQQQQGQMNMIRPQQMGQNIQVSNQAHQQQLIPMGQIQGNNIIFSSNEQRPLPQQLPKQQIGIQMLNFHQPTRQVQNQFRRSTIINLSETGNQPQIPMNHQRNLTQNQNTTFQQPRQTVIIDKPFFSQVSQPQRQILVNTINHNPEVNRMIRPTYPLGNQQVVAVSQF